MPSKQVEEHGFRAGSAVVVLLAVAGLISLAWYARETSQDQKNASYSGITMIEPESDILKEAPEDPGGRDYPHEDKQVYKIINPAERDGAPLVKITRPAPPPVIPPVEGSIQREEAVAELKRRAENVTTSQAPVAKPKPQPAPEPKPAPKPVVVKTPEPVKVKPVQAAPKTGNVALQLGAFRSEAEAKAQWGKISSKHRALSGYGYRVVRADLGDKGIYYRLRATGFASKAQAGAACGKLKAAGQACFTVK